MADQISVIVALPTIADHFNSDLPTVQWVVVGYAVIISALLLPMGRLSDILGLKRVYVGGFAIFVIGAVLASFSTSVTTLILSRVLQGCGAAMIQATGMAIVASLFPSSERGKAMGLILSVVGAGAIAGPALGGLWVSVLNWRWVFFVSVPSGILAITAALIVLEKGRLQQGSHRPRFDWMGATLSAGMLLAFLMAMTNGPRTGWESPFIVGAMLAFIALLGSLYLVGASRP